MAKETCGELFSCAWRVAERLTAAGRATTAHDICLAIGDSGEPCGRAAISHFGAHENIAADGFGWHPGQPFCQEHATQILQDAMLQLKEHSKNKPAYTKLIQASQREIATNRAVQAKKRHNKGFVYFARRGDHLKIGTSVNVPKRIRNIETQSGFPFDEVVVTEGGRALEQKYHRAYSEHRVLGEWFIADPAITAEMERLRPDQPAFQIL